MASVGPNSPATTANDTSTGTLNWTSPGNATSSNNADAVASAESATTRYLLATDFGFSIDTEATITGIIVEVDKASDEGCWDAGAYIVKGGLIGGSSSTNRKLSGNWPASDTYKTHGLFQTDLWGESWSASDINASNFGFAISATLGGDPGTGYVDHIRITINYTAGAVSGASPTHAIMRGTHLGIRRGIAH